jgi:hypothetical protein
MLHRLRGFVERPRQRESPEPRRGWSRRFLAAHRPILMLSAAYAFGQRQLMIRAPGKEPCLHVLMPDVVPGLHLAVRVAELRQHLFLVGNVRLYRIGNEEVRAAAGSLCQLGQPLLCCRFQPDAQGCRHGDILVLDSD